MYFLAGMCANANKIIFLVLMSITETRICRRKGRASPHPLGQKNCSAVLLSGRAPAAMPMGLGTGLRKRSCVLLGTKLSKDRDLEIRETFSLIND